MYKNYFNFSLEKNTRTPMDKLKWISQVRFGYEFKERGICCTHSHPVRTYPQIIIVENFAYKVDF